LFPNKLILILICDMWNSLRGNTDLNWHEKQVLLEHRRLSRRF